MRAATTKPDDLRIAALRAAVAAAEKARADLEWSDDACMTSGSWSRANDAVLRATRELNEALLQMIEAQGAAIVATGEAVVAELRRIEEIARDAMAAP